jgi:putative two-component system response regulator
MAVLLIVEDEDDIRLSLVQELEQDHQVLTAEDGVSGLDALHGVPRPDLVILDLMMPDLDGWGFVKAKNADSIVAGIPVIVMTARSCAEARAQGLDGAQLIIHKPFELDVLLTAIQTLTRKD